MLLYGTRLRINYSSPGNIWKLDFFNFLISWKYWKSGFSDCLVSWKYWKSGFSNFLVAWKYWKLKFSNFLVAWKYWRSGFSDCLVSWKYGRRAGGGGRAAPGVVLCCLGLFLEHVSWNFWISWKYWKYDFSWFLGFLQKRRAPKFHAEWSNFHAEISHMRPIQARKLKLFQTPISE